jgi:hypothetical protein
MKVLSNISQLLYSKYKYNENIPIECLVNICLLLKGYRKIIQFDRYLYSKIQWDHIEEFLKDILIKYNDKNIEDTNNGCWKYITNKLMKLVKRNKNYVLYLDENITQEIEISGIDKVMDNYLDKKFYNYCNFNTDKCKTNVTRVSFNIIGPVESGNVYTGEINLNQLKLVRNRNYFGQLLLMECNEEEIQKNITDIYTRFMDYKRYISEIDTDLQLSLELYTKFGIWENQPFLKVETLNYSE